MESIQETLDISEVINIIKRQTDYTDIIAEEKLVKFDYDVENVLRDYMGIKPKPKMAEKSANQERYKMIRASMDIIDTKKKM